MPEQMKISVGFERDISIGYQSWKFHTYFEETIENTSLNFDVITTARRRMQLRATGAVYVDILNRFDDIVTALKEANNVHGQLVSLKKEATDALNKIQAELKSMDA